MMPTRVNTYSELHNGMIMCDTAISNTYITYEHNFTTVLNHSDILVPSSVLTLAVPLDYQHIGLCLECGGEYFHFKVSGTKDNFTSCN